MGNPCTPAMKAKGTNWSVLMAAVLYRARYASCQ
jgi:hypothetical protein